MGEACERTTWRRITNGLVTLTLLSGCANHSNDAPAGVDLNKAPKERLLRVPGLGTRNVKRVLMARRHGALRIADMARLRAPVAKLLPFVQLADHHPRQRLDDPAALRAQLAPKPRQADLFAA